MTYDLETVTGAVTDAEGEVYDRLGSAWYQRTSGQRRYPMVPVTVEPDGRPDVSRPARQRVEVTDYERAVEVARVSLARLAAGQRPRTADDADADAYADAYEHGLLR